MNNQFKNLLQKAAESLPNNVMAADFVVQLHDHSDDLVKDLLTRLDYAEPLVKAASAFALGHLNTTFWPNDFDTLPAIPKLLRLVSHDDSYLAFYATMAVVLVQIGGVYEWMSDEQMVASYARCLETGDLPLKIVIANQLRNSGPDGVLALPTLSRLLSHSDKKLRETARETIDAIRLSGCSRV